MYFYVLASLASLTPLALATTIPAIVKRIPTDVTQLSPSVSTVQLELGPRLSNNASIYFPNNSNFAAANKRWSAAVDPTFIVVVVPSVDNNVAATVGSTIILG